MNACVYRRSEVQGITPVDGFGGETVQSSRTVVSFEKHIDPFPVRADGPGTAELFVIGQFVVAAADQAGEKFVSLIVGTIAKI